MRIERQKEKESAPKRALSESGKWSGAGGLGEGRGRPASIGHGRVTSVGAERAGPGRARTRAATARRSQPGAFRHHLVPQDSFSW